MLDLYFQFSRKVGLPTQVQNLTQERHETEEEISRILKTECSSYSRKCSFCGKELSWDYPFSICERCFEKGRSSHPHGRGGGRSSGGRGKPSSYGGNGGRTGQRASGGSKPTPARGPKGEGDGAKTTPAAPGETASGQPSSGGSKRRRRSRRGNGFGQKREPRETPEE